MQNSTEIQCSNAWHWQDFLSSYRFWGLVLASTLIVFTRVISQYSIFNFMNRVLGVGDGNFSYITSTYHIGSIVSVFIILYFLRRRMKLALVLFAGLMSLSTFIFFSGYLTNLALLILVYSIFQICVFGFKVGVIATFISGRPAVRDFVIAYAVVLIWEALVTIIAPRLQEGVVEFEHYWIAGFPALLAFIALLPMSSKMFSAGPQTVIESKSPQDRHPFVVFLCAAFVPFYFLYWIFQRPAELKSLAPEVKQPSRIGALCTAIFAPFILPIWFHEVRATLADRLPNRSPGWLGVICFFFPRIAAAMAQSDNNALMTTLDANGDEADPFLV